MSDPQKEFQELLRDTKALLKSMQAAGVNEVPAASAQSETYEPAKTNPSIIKDSAVTVSSPAKEKLFGPLRVEALACQRCKLCKTRNKVVFGEGSLDAELVFVGEGPGRDEDEQGMPFVGMAGKLLTKIIEAMKMTREQVYICNVVKCRPPQNRPPEPDEVEACIGYLKQQLQTIKPKIIVALGKTAAAALLETEAPMSALRGRLFEWNGIPLAVTYHPAYLLRNPAAKKDVWEDMQRVMRYLDGQAF